MSGREKRDIREEGERYKYPQPQRLLKSRQCRGSSMVVLLSRCGTAAPGKITKGKSEVLAILAK